MQEAPPWGTEMKISFWRLQFILKHYFCHIGLYLLILHFLCGIGQAQEDSLPVGEFKKAISNALSQAANLNAAEPYFLVKQVTLDLSVLKKTDAHGASQLVIPVFRTSIANLGAKIQELALQRIQIEMKPAKQAIVGGARDLQFGKLLQLIKDAFKQEKGDSSDLIISKLTYVVSFQLQREVDGGIDFLIVSAGAASSETQHQMVTFLLCETRNLRDCAA